MLPAYLGSPVMMIAGIGQAIYLRRCLGAGASWPRIIRGVLATLILAWLATVVIWLSLGAAFPNSKPSIMVFGFLLLPALISVAILVPGMSWWLCRSSAATG
jgi:hypothetical protein